MNAAWSMLDRIFGWGGVLAYHGVGSPLHSPGMHVSAERMREQLAYLSARYEVLPLYELVDRWQRGLGTRGCVAITFDDAYAGVVHHAGGILRELELPATIFVASAFSHHGAAFWWDVAELDRLDHAGRDWIALPRTVGLAPFTGSDASAMNVVRERVLGANGGRWIEPPASPREPSPWRAATFEELRALARDSRIDFGVHTVNHPALPMLPFAEQVREIRECHAALLGALPRVLPMLAYPYGLYDRSTVRAAREAGMAAAFTIEGRAPGPRPAMYTIPRVGAGEVHDPESLQRRLSRALRPALVLRNRGVHPRIPRPIPASPAAEGNPASTGRAS